MNTHKAAGIRQLVGVVVGVGLLACLGLATLGGGAWWLVQEHVGADAARLWALLATVGLPVVLAVGYWLGRVESRGLVAGLDTGIGKAMDAASKTANLRVNVLRATQRPVPPAPLDPRQVVIIPAPAPAMGGGDDVLLLE